jgi:hypothetical protein
MSYKLFILQVSINPQFSSLKNMEENFLFKVKYLFEAGLTNKKYGHALLFSPIPHCFWSCRLTDGRKNRQHKNCILGKLGDDNFF